MMKMLEGIMIVLMLVFCIQAGKTDIRDGKVYNKTLLVFGCIGMVLDILYYSIFNKTMIVPFMINLAVMIVTSLVLFYSHSFAGGDCKLLMVLTLFYPANYYISYSGSLITVVFTVGIALFFGYVYLLATSIYELIIKKNRMSVSYVKGYFMAFFKSFGTAIVYISAVTLSVSVLAFWGIVLPIWLVRILCILTSLMIGKYPVFKKKFVIGMIVGVDFILSILLKTIPFSIHPENYILVVVLLVCQMTIKTSLYQEVHISNLKKGMILTMGSSLLMQNSRVRGLPKISSEDLRDRLTEDEIASINRWAKSRKIESLSIVKKIPFATFIACGYICYLIFWRILKWC